MRNGFGTNGGENSDPSGLRLIKWRMWERNEKRIWCKQTSKFHSIQIWDWKMKMMRMKHVMDLVQMEHKINEVQMKVKIPPYKVWDWWNEDDVNETWNEFGTKGPQNSASSIYNLIEKKRYEQNAKWMRYKWSLKCHPFEFRFDEVIMVRMKYETISVQVKGKIPIFLKWITFDQIKMKICKYQFDVASANDKENAN